MRFWLPIWEDALKTLLWYIHWFGLIPKSALICNKSSTTRSIQTHDEYSENFNGDDEEGGSTNSREEIGNKLKIKIFLKQKINRKKKRRKIIILECFCKFWWIYVLLHINIVIFFSLHWQRNMGKNENDLTFVCVCACKCCCYERASNSDLIHPTKNAFIEKENNNRIAREREREIERASELEPKRLVEKRILLIFDSSW